MQTPLNSNKVDIVLLQKHLLKLLKKIIFIAEKNNINYHIAFGNVLGAVRHQGFIPWDDDVDICIIGDDYDRFLKIMNKEKSLTVVTKDKFPKLPLFFAKIVDTNYTYHEKDKKTNKNYPDGLYIDIFKMVYVKNNITKKPWNLYLWEGINYLKNADKKNFFAKILKTFFYFLPQKRINLKVSKNIKKIESNLPTSKMMDIYNDSSTFVYDANLFKSTKMLLFEDIKIKVPFKTDNYLKRVFGENYMRLPAMKKRKSHCREFEIKKGEKNE